MIISGQIPPVPEYRGDLKEWTREISIYLERILRDHQEDLKNIDEIVVTPLTETDPVAMAYLNQGVKTDSDPTFGSLTLSDLTSAGFVKNNASGVLSGGNSIAISDVSSLTAQLEEIDVKYLDKDTAVDVIVGCLVDSGDGKTVLTDDSELVLADITCAIYKGSTRTAITLSSSNFVHQADGYWKLSLTSSHTDTAGYLLITIRDDDVMLPYKERFVVK